MKLSDFDFDLPEELIATRPVRPRTASRLLVATPDSLTDAHVGDLTDWLRPGDRLILNDTKVIPGRLFGTRTRPGQAPGEGVANIEVTLLSPDGQGQWHAMAKPLRKLKEGDVIAFSDALNAEFLGRDDDQAVLRFNLEGDAFDVAIAEAGKMPLPPYIAAKRAADEQDNEDYQTVFARNTGAVAAPTASLHFDEELLSKIEAMGVGLTHVTLHVGAGTFLPVKVDDVSKHKMHAEWGEVCQSAADQINATLAAGTRDPRGHHRVAFDRKRSGGEGADCALDWRDRYLHHAGLRLLNCRRADDQLPPAEIHADDAGLSDDGDRADARCLCPCDR